MRPPSPVLAPRPASIPSHSSPSFPIGDLPRGHQLRGTFLFRSRGDIINSRQHRYLALLDFLLTGLTEGPTISRGRVAQTRSGLRFRKDLSEGRMSETPNLTVN